MYVILNFMWPLFLTLCFSIGLHFNFSKSAVGLLFIVVFLLNNPEFWTWWKYKGWTTPEKFYYVNKSRQVGRERRKEKGCFSSKCSGGLKTVCKLKSDVVLEGICFTFRNHRKQLFLDLILFNILSFANFYEMVNEIKYFWF